MKGIFLKKRHIGVEINHDFSTQLQGIKYFKQVGVVELELYLLPT
jgi:hypothetical protein